MYSPDTEFLKSEPFLRNGTSNYETLNGMDLKSRHILSYLHLHYLHMTPDLLVQ